MPSLPSFYFEGSSLSSPEEAYWTWRKIMSPLFDVSLPCDQAVKTFRIELDSYHLGPLLLGSVGSSAQRFRRSPATIARSGVDHYLVQLYTQGGYEGEAEGRTMRVNPGDISVLDLSRTLHTQAESFHNLTLVVPRPVVAPLLRNPDGLHGLVLSGQSGLGHLLATYLRTIHKTASSLSPDEGARISQATAHLVVSCFGPSADAHEAATSAKKGALILSVKRYIDANLAEPDLTIDRIVHEFHVSRATLTRMFGSLGGVASYIRERRMLRCFAQITSPAHAHRSIAELAYSWGFGNEAAFSRAFRRMFDMSPREARAETGQAQRTVRHRRSGPDGSDGRIIEQWIRHLQG